MAIVKQATSRVINRNPPLSYDGKYQSWRTKFNFRSAWGKARPAVADVLEVFSIPPKHVIDHFVIKTSKALTASGGAYSLGILKGTVNTDHTGTGDDDDNRQLSSGITGIDNTDANNGLANTDVDIVFDYDADKRRAFGFYCTTAATGDLPADAEVEIMVRYFNGEYVD